MNWLYSSLAMPLSLLVAALVPASAMAARPATAAVPSIELGDFMGRLRSVQVTVAGQSGTFLLDTGGGVTLVTPAFASRIGCSPWGQITGFRLTGERLDLPRCEQVAVGLPGGVKLAPVTAGVMDIAPLLPPGAPAVDGSLALDALDGQMFTIDLAAGTLVMETPDSLAKQTAGAVQLPIRVARHGSSGHGLGVYLQQPSPKGELSMGLDSGSGAPVLLGAKVASVAGADAALPAKPQPYTLVLPGKDGEVKLQTRAIVRDMIHDGMIGMPVLVHWRLSFDLAGDRLWVMPAKP